MTVEPERAQRIRTLSGRTVARLGAAGAFLLAILVRIRHLDFVQLWDGRQYWDHCIEPALLGGFDPIAFNCFGHRSMLYMLAVSGPQAFSHGSTLLLNLAQLALSLITIAAFFRIATLLFPPSDEPATGLDAAGLTILFSAMPIWTAGSLTISPDFGVLCGFVVALALLLGGQRHWAVVAGVFMVLSKEVGLLLWLVLAGIETFLAVVDRGTQGRRLRILAMRLIYVVPVAAYVATGMALRARELVATWTDPGGQPSLIRTFLTFGFRAPHERAYLADIFALNFAWVLSIFLVAWLIVAAIRLHRRQPLPLPPTLDRHRGLFIAILAPAVFHLITRYPTFNNARYILAAVPLVVLVFGIAAASLVRRPLLRAGVFVVAATLQLASMWATVDPVSRFIFGTFPFGTHPMLSMTSIRGECCGSGRDQLVYNLQFTHFDDVQNKVFETIRPRDREPIVIGMLANWFVVGALDAQTYHRTLRTAGVIRPTVFSVVALSRLDVLPERLRYLAFANVPNSYDLELLHRAYEISPGFDIDEHGYRATIFELRRREGALPWHLVPRRP